MESLCGYMKDEIAYAFLLKEIYAFYVPPLGLGRLEYEPLQQRFKPGDMLWLQRLAPKAKIPRRTYDLGSLDIMAELGPGGPLGGKIPNEESRCVLQSNPIKKG